MGTIWQNRQNASLGSSVPASSLALMVSKAVLFPVSQSLQTTIMTRRTQLKFLSRQELQIRKEGIWNMADLPQYLAFPTHCLRFVAYFAKTTTVDSFRIDDMTPMLGFLLARFVRLKSFDVLFEKIYHCLARFSTLRCVIHCHGKGALVI